MSDLKAKLDAAMSATDAAAHPELINYHECIFRMELDRAYRSGDLIVKDGQTFTQEDLDRVLASKREIIHALASSVVRERGGPITLYDFGYEGGDSDGYPAAQELIDYATSDKDLK